MNEGVPMMFHGGGGFGGPGMYLYSQVDRSHYPIEMLPAPAALASQGSNGRRWHHRERPKENVTTGYDSDDSSLSSNASGSTKSGEKGEGGTRTGGSERSSGGVAVRGSETGGQSREWRGRRPQRRIAPDRYLNATYPFQTKYTPDDLLNGSKWDTLSQEIWDKFIRSQQTEETFRRKMNLWRFLFVNIKRIFHRYGLYVVGSTMSGFGLDSSDMDLCLFVRADEHIEPRAHALYHLNHILGYIKNFDPDAELIQAKVPIVKFRAHGLSVDLNCNNVVGIRNTELLRAYSKSDWRVRPLVAMMKLWAQAHDINDARQKTLSSYSLTLMVIHFLQCGTRPAILARGFEACAWDTRARAPNRTPLGELFLQMLKYYAEFPYEKMAVSVRVGARVPVAECRLARTLKNDPHQWKLLCVEEPFDLTNTARSVYDADTFERIVTTFKKSYERLSTGLRLADAWPQR